MLDSSDASLRASGPPKRNDKLLITHGFPALNEGREKPSQGREAVTLSCGNRAVESAQKARNGGSPT